MKIIGRMVGVCLALGVMGAVAAPAYDNFDDPATDANWSSPRGFRFVDGAGVGGSRCVVWEESEVRPMPTDEEKSDKADGNEVSGGARDGRTRFNWKMFEVEPGCQYAFTVSLKGQITNNCGYTYFTWYDKDRKPINSAVGKPKEKAIWKTCGTRGWEQLTVTSARLPSNAVYGRFFIEVYRTTLGRMAFDDFKMTVTEPIHYDQILNSAYRDELETGTVRFLVPYTLSALKYPPEKLRATFTFEGQEGPLVLPADRIDAKSFEVSFDVARLRSGTHPVRAELLCGETGFGTVTSSFTRLAAPSTRKVNFDAEGRTLLNGKPFFPHGVFIHPADTEIAFLDKLEDSPFNCVIECSSRRTVLDKLWKAGLYAIPKPPREAEAAAGVVADRRGHPAVLGWYILDETPAYRAAEKKALHAACHAADPDHPTYAVFDVAENIPDFMGGFDVGGNDPYPISSHGDPNRPLDVAACAEFTQDCAFRLRPYWQVPQAFAWDWCSKRGRPDLDRFPTFEELRLMAWQSIAGGANGLLWYAASQIFRNAKDGEREHYWSDLKSVALEVKAYEPWIVSGEPSPKVRTKPANAAVRAFRRDGRVALLVTGLDRGAVDGEVAVEGFAPVKVNLGKRDCVWMTLD